MKNASIVLAAIALALACGAIACGGQSDATSTPSAQTSAGASPGATQGPTPARQADLRIKEGVHAISIGLQSWATSQSTLHYPPVADSATLGKYMTDPWPANPLTGADMRPGSEPGDYTYRVATDRKSCTVTGHLSDGCPYMPQVLR